MLDFCMNQAEMMLLDPGVSDYTKLGPTSDTVRVYQGMKDLRVNRVRMGAIWSYVNPSKGKYNWVDLDRAVIMASRFGLKPHLVLGLVTPNWSPTTVDFGEMAKAVAARYGSAGMNLVLSYEIMNEQNNVGNFSPCTPEHYVPYLKAAYTGIHSAHPTAIVVSGGLMPINDGFFSMSPLNFVKGMYTSGAKGFFDALGNHPYAIDLYFKQIEPTATTPFQKMDDDIYAVMVANGDGGKQIWWTEMGYAVPPSTLAEQLAWMPEHIEIWKQKTTEHVGPCFMYNYRCSGTDTSNLNFNFGIVNYDYSKRPVWDYVNTINAGVAPDLSGSGSLTAKVTSRAVLSGSGSLTAYQTVNIKLPVTLSGSGALTGALFGRPAAQASGVGALSADVVVAVNRTVGLSGSGSLTATSDTVRRATVAMSGSGVLSATVGQQAVYSYNFDGTGNIKPTALFTDFGQGYSVGATKSSVAVNNNAAPVDGVYYSGGIWKKDQGSADHFAEVATAPLGSGYTGLPDRSNMPIVRSSADGSQFVAAYGHWGGGGSTAIVTMDAGVLTVRNTSRDGWQSDGDVMRLTADGDTYTLTKNGTVVLTWVDVGNVFGGASNRRTGFGFQHLWASGLPWVAPGISHVWRGQDVRLSVIVPPAPVPVVGSLASDGALVAVSVMSYKSLASLSGAGALSATLGGGIPALLTGTGALAASVGRTVAASGLSGSGSLTGVGVPNYNALGSLSGDGLLTASLGAAQVAYGATGTEGKGTPSSGTTLTATGSHTANAGDTLVIVDVTVRAVSSSSSVSIGTIAVTYGGVAMTPIDAALAGPSATSSPYSRTAVQQFYLMNPPTGVQATVTTCSTSATISGSNNIISVDSVSYSAAGTPVAAGGAYAAASASNTVTTNAVVPTGAMAHFLHYRIASASNGFTGYNRTTRATAAQGAATWLIGDEVGSGTTITSTAAQPTAFVYVTRACIIPAK